MARLASKIKLGYYPTPELVTPLIAGTLQADKGFYRLLDPCAGKGIALNAVAQTLRQIEDVTVETLGVELSPNRSKVLQENVDHALLGTWRDVAMTDKSVSLLYLNPPYDYSWGPEVRLEAEFLEHTYKRLRFGGVLAYLIPKSILADRGVARRLASHFEDVTVWRFPDGEYERFKQVVVLAYRKPHKAPTEEQIREVQALAEADLSPLAPGCASYELQTVPQEITFRMEAISNYRKVALAHKMGWPDEIVEELVPKEAPEIKPLIPPKKGHIAMILASGMFRTAPIIENGQVTLLKGRAIKYQEVKEETQQRRGKEVKVTTTIDRFRTTVGMVHPDGTTTVVDNDEAELRKLLQEYGPQITKKILETEPLYNFDPTDEEWARLGELSKNRDPLPGQDEPGMLPSQKHLAMAGLRSLQDNGRLLIQGEMGVGKTTILLAIIDMLDAYPALIMVPPHLQNKWPREAYEVIPGVEVRVLERIGKTSSMDHEVNSVREFLDDYKSGKLGEKAIAILPRSMAKLGPGYRGAAVKRYVHKRKAIGDGFRNQLSLYRVEQEKIGKSAVITRENWWESSPPLTEAKKLRQAALNQVVAYPVCPTCYEPQMKENKKGQKVYADFKDFKRTGSLRRIGLTCSECKEPLYDYGGGERRWPLADYIFDHCKGEFEFFAADEVHDYKGRSQQGRAFARLVQSCKYAVGMTGTIFGGAPVSIYWILHRMGINGIQHTYDYNSDKRFTQQYGVLKNVKVREGRTRRYGGYVATETVENRTTNPPGVSPQILEHLMRDVLFVTLDQLGVDLPDFDDRYAQIAGDAEQTAQWNALSDELLGRAVEHKAYLSLWLQWALGRPNSAFRDEVAEKLWRDEDGEVERTEHIMDLPSQIEDDDQLLPKEEWLVRFAKAESAKKRATLVYCRQTDTRDIRGRLKDVLENVGLKVAVLDSSVSTKKREEWIDKHAYGIDVLIVNPELVKTGLDLVQFSSIVFYEPIYSLFTLWQAERRVWRLGQEKPVKVAYLAYRDSWEEKALALMGKKKQAAQMVYGDDIGGAIVPKADDTGSFKAELMKTAVEGAELPDLDQLFNAEPFDLAKEEDIIDADYTVKEPVSAAETGEIVEGTDVHVMHPVYGGINGKVVQLNGATIEVRYTDTYGIGLETQEVDRDVVRYGERPVPVTMVQLAARMQAKAAEERKAKEKKGRRKKKKKGGNGQLSFLDSNNNINEEVAQPTLLDTPKEEPKKKAQTHTRYEYQDGRMQFKSWDQPEKKEEDESVLVYAYTPEDALEDGTYVDISNLAQEAGFTWQTVITRGVDHLVDDIPPSHSHQDRTGRLWDVLNVARVAIKKNGRLNGQVPFSLIMHHKPNGNVKKTVKLIAARQLRNNGEPMVVIMTPQEV